MADERWRKAMGARVKALREGAGLTQEALALAAGVPAGTLRGWEYGRREPLLSAALGLAKALGVAVEEIAPGELAEAPAPAPRRKARAPAQPARKRGRPRKDRAG